MAAYVGVSTHVRVISDVETIPGRFASQMNNGDRFGLFPDQRDEMSVPLIALNSSFCLN